mgnify:CR=1 FL=1
MTKDERQYQARLRDYGCAVCARIGMPCSLASIHHVRKHGGRRDLQEMNVIPLCPTHHSELHANRRNYGALYGIEEQALADEMRMLHDPETRLHGRLRSVQSQMDSKIAEGVA